MPLVRDTLIVDKTYTLVGLAWFVETEGNPATYPPMGGGAEQLPWQPIVTGTPEAITDVAQALQRATINEDVHLRVFIDGYVEQNTALFLYWLREVAQGTRKSIEVTLSRRVDDDEG